MALQHLSDEEVVRRVREGKVDAFEVLVERYRRGIANFVSAGLRDANEAADLTQETFLRAYAHLGTFNPQLGKFSSWVYQIARNVVRTHLGRSLRRPRAQQFPEDQTLENALPDLSREGDPSGGLLREEAERELREALSELPERSRTVLALRYFDNMEYATIAGTLGLSLGNVKTLIHRGKLALAKKMREREERGAMQGTAAKGGRSALLLV